MENVATLTNKTGVLVEPASVNIRKNPTTNEYVDADITNKTITVTIPGKAFTGTEERWIEIKQGATITKAKYKIEGNNVTEQPWARKTILTVTDDFSGYTKDIPATINVYLTATATKPVATATLKVIDMPFNLVFFKTDHLGTPRVITDQDGKVLSTHDYLAYGEELTDPEFTTNRMKFTGHERDPETGLDYMLARYYSAGSGRFLQVDPGYDYDPMDPMSLNLYSYVRGNPVKSIDPDGRKALEGGSFTSEFEVKTGKKIGLQNVDAKEFQAVMDIPLKIAGTIGLTLVAEAVGGGPGVAYYGFSQIETAITDLGSGQLKEMPNHLIKNGVVAALSADKVPKKQVVKAIVGSALMKTISGNLKGATLDAMIKTAAEVVASTPGGKAAYRMLTTLMTRLMEKRSKQKEKKKLIPVKNQQSNAAPRKES